MSPKGRRRIRIAVGLACVVAGTIPLAWLAAPGLLVRDTGLPGAREVRIDAIVVLGGEPTTRAERAAEVYRQVAGENPGRAADSTLWVLATGEGDCEDARRQLEACAVPASAILTECKSTSTLENAAFSVPRLRERRATNVVIVTSWFHSRRALACFREANPEMHFYSQPTVHPPQPAWWPDRHERGRILSEYGKLIYYWLVHGVSPMT